MLENVSKNGVVTLKFDPTILHVLTHTKKDVDAFNVKCMYYKNKSKNKQRNVYYCKKKIRIISKFICNYYIISIMLGYLWLFSYTCLHVPWSPDIKIRDS